MNIVAPDSVKNEFIPISPQATGLLALLLYCVVPPTLSIGNTALPKPKYGPEITLLSKSHEFMRQKPAQDYWAISPYYLSQQDDRACSVASVAMIVNAARTSKILSADDELVTQQGLLKKVKDEIWSNGVGASGRGVTLDQLKPIVEKSLQAFGVIPHSVEVHHVSDLTESTRRQLLTDLTQNEKSASDFIIINFIQGVLTGDAHVGHIAPIGAYDAGKKQVLIMDPDRQWYEPYWVSEDALLKAMATIDKESGKFRGYIYIKTVNK